MGDKRCSHYKRCGDKSDILARCCLFKGHQGEHRAGLPHEFGDGIVSWKEDSSRKIVIKGHYLAERLIKIYKIWKNKGKSGCPHCQPFGNDDWLLSQCYLPGGHDGEHCAGVPIEFDGSYPGDSVVHWKPKKMMIMVINN